MIRSESKLIKEKSFSNSLKFCKIFSLEYFNATRHGFKTLQQQDTKIHLDIYFNLASNKTGKFLISNHLSPCRFSLFRQLLGPTTVDLVRASGYETYS